MAVTTPRWIMAGKYVVTVVIEVFGVLTMRASNYIVM